MSDPSKAHDYVGAAYTTLETNDPKTSCRLIWCINKVGREAIGLAYTPKKVSKRDLEPGLEFGVRNAPLSNLY
jgi:hypothetical protein